MSTAAPTLRIAAMLAMLGVALSLALPVQAGPRLASDRSGAEESARSQRQDPGEFRRSWRDQHLGDVAGASNGANHAGQMSPEERRQLRRDIRDAGQDVYRPGRPDRAPRRY